jgi:hypothetical protein
MRMLRREAGRDAPSAVGEVAPQVESTRSQQPIAINASNTNTARFQVADNLQDRRGFLGN